MTITQEEGNEIAEKVLASWTAGFVKNNHSETMKGLFADKLAWSWPEGTVGEGCTSELMDIIKNKWGTLIGTFVFSTPIVCVDTDQSRIVIACQAIFNITGGLYDENSNNLIVNDNVWILKLNQDKKITRWSMVWNPNKDTMVKAMDKVMTKLGKKTPEPNEHPSITLEEGLNFANDFMKALSSGFIESNHTETLSKLFSDHLYWDWSDGTKGEGSYQEVMAILHENWSTMVDSLFFANPIVAVDTNRSVIAVVSSIVINVTGGFKDENNPVKSNVAYVVHLDDNWKKAIKFDIAWDNNDPALQAALSDLMLLPRYLRVLCLAYLLRN